MSWNVMKMLRSAVMDFWMKNEICETKMSRNVTKCDENVTKCHKNECYEKKGFCGFWNEKKKVHVLN